MLTDERTNKQISAAIAKLLFEKIVCQPDYELCTNEWRARCAIPCSVYIEPFASRFAAALGLVVPEMRKLGYELRIEDELDRGVVNVQFSNGRVCGIAEQPFGLEPRAICLAAEAALDAERNTE